MMCEWKRLFRAFHSLFANDLYFMEFTNDLGLLYSYLFMGSVNLQSSQKSGSQECRLFDNVLPYLA